MFFELLLRAGVGKRSPRQIGRALPDGQIQPLDERGVQRRGVLGVFERFLETPGRSHHASSFHLHDAIIPARLEDLAIETSGPKDATEDLFVEIESVGDDQRKTPVIHSVGNVASKRQSVSVASSSGHRRWPEPRPHFDRDENPRGPLLVAGEGTNLVGLQLLDNESRDPSVVEATASVRRPLEPTSDGVPGNPFDSSNRRNTDTFDPESNDLVKGVSMMLETVVRRALCRRERLSTPDAAVSTAPPGPCSVETVPDDVSGTDFSMQRTLGVETAQLGQFAWPCRRKNCVVRNQAQTLARERVRGWLPTLDRGSTE